MSFFSHPQVYGVRCTLFCFQFLYKFMKKLNIFKLNFRCPSVQTGTGLSVWSGKVGIEFLGLLSFICCTDEYQWKSIKTIIGLYGYRRIDKIPLADFKSCKCHPHLNGWTNAKITKSLSFSAHRHEAAEVACRVRSDPGDSLRFEWAFNTSREVLDIQQSHVRSA